MDRNDLNVLDEVNKGCTRGMDAIEFVSKKVGDEVELSVLRNKREVNIKIKLGKKV